MIDVDAAIPRRAPLGPGALSLSLLSWPSRRLNDLWLNTTARARLVVKLIALVLCVAIAYNYSLLTLLQLANLQTPLAYASLVPAVALGVAAMRASQDEQATAIGDRRVDYLVGLLLILVAIAINLVLPARLSVMFWAWRIDLFSMPLYVTGLVSMLFGVTVVRQQRLALAYLFLAWPLLWNAPLLSVLNAVTDVTLSALRAALRVVHLATPLPGSNADFQIVHHGTTFTLSVISACSGVNGVAGFVFVGCAFGAVVTGPRLKKAAWLLAGMIVIWAMNLVRLLFLFWAGGRFGEGIAINVLHPFTGLVTFSIGVAGMLLLLPVIGLSISLPGKVHHDATDTLDAQRPAVQKVLAALVVGIATCLILGAANLNLRVYNLASGSAAEPRLVAMTGTDARPVTPQGWTSRYVAQITWAMPFFGDTSTWYRYLYKPTGGTNNKATPPIAADVVNTTALSTFSAYGVTQSYPLGEYHLQDFARVSVAHDITAQTLSFTSAASGNWSFLCWIVPVKNGTSTHFERTVVYLHNTTTAIADNAGADDSVQNLSGNLDPATAQGRALKSARAYLIAFARDLVASQEQTGGTVNIVRPHAASPRTDPE